jgi:hypothetical protein
VGDIKTRSYVTGSGVDGVTSTSTSAAILSQIQSFVSHYDLGDHNFFNTGNLGFTPYSRWMNMGMAVAQAAGIPDATTSSSWAPGNTYDVRLNNWAGYVSTKWQFHPLAMIWTLWRACARSTCTRSPPATASTPRRAPLRLSPIRQQLLRPAQRQSALRSGPQPPDPARYGHQGRGPARPVQGRALYVAQPDRADGLCGQPQPQTLYRPAI